MARSRNYVFTLNNYTDAEVVAVQSVQGTKFIGYGLEVGQGGTPHLQGLVCFSHAKTLGAAKEALSPRVHLESMRGNTEQAWTYCCKDGNIWSRGTRPRTAAEVGLLNADRYRQFIEHARANNVVDADPELFVRYHATFLRIAAQHIVMPANNPYVCGVWIHGDPGSGKSHAVNASHPTAYRKMCNKWWDGYRDQPVVWLDDIDPSSSSWIAHFLKIWADKWAFTAEMKGTSISIRPTKFIVTSNYTIDGMNFRVEDLEAIKRRFVQIHKIREQMIIL